MKEQIRHAPQLTRFLQLDCLQGESFYEFIEAIGRQLPGTIKTEVLLDSLLHLAGKKLTPAVLQQVAWQLAGNLPRLRAWHAVPPWNRQPVPEYVPLQIVTAKVAQLKQRPAAEFELLVLAGTPAGLTITKLWSQRFCAAISQRLGFSKPWGSHRFHHVLELVNLRFYGLLTPELCGLRPDFAEIWYTADNRHVYPSSVLTHNRSFIRLRGRDPKHFVCPRNYPRTQPCHLCPIGQDECLAAVHDATYVQKRCGQCRRMSWFDPAHPRRTICVNCHNTNQLKRDQ